MSQRIERVIQYKYKCAVISIVDLVTFGVLGPSGRALFDEAAGR